MDIIDLPPTEWNEAKRLEPPKARFKVALREVARAMVLGTLRMFAALFLFGLVAGIGIGIPMMAVGAIDWFLPLSYTGVMVAFVAVVGVLGLIFHQYGGQEDPVTAGRESAGDGNRGSPGGRGRIRRLRLRRRRKCCPAAASVSKPHVMTGNAVDGHAERVSHVARGHVEGGESCGGDAMLKHLTGAYPPRDG